MSGASTTAFDPEKYGALFAHGIAHTITTDAENQAAIEELEAYSFAENQTSEEEAYCEVLATLIEQYEKRYRLDITLNPVETLKLLMENRGLKQADLVPAIDSKSHLSEILSGTRELSKAHIMKLSNFFHVSPEVFFPSAGDRFRSQKSRGSAAEFPR
jgi:HTH-type transcriptional regulator / antitoxin HigA